MFDLVLNIFNYHNFISFKKDTLIKSSSSLSIFYKICTNSLNSMCFHVSFMKLVPYVFIENLFSQAITESKDFFQRSIISITYGAHYDAT